MFTNARMTKGAATMKEHPSYGASERRSPWMFFLLVFALAIPFWVAGPVAERFLANGLPVSLPISSLMACCPIIAAVILVRRREGPAAAKELLKRAFDCRRITRRAWYMPILLLNPAVMVLQYGWMRLVGVPLPDVQVPVLMVAVSFVVFFIGAVGEEVGWQGYANDPLQDRWNALAAGMILGIVGAVWHIIPLIQMDRTPAWIAWHCLSMVALRIVVVWLYSSAGRSVFAAILFHAMYNLSTVLLPGYGWPYDPTVAFAILAVAVAIITFLWGPETLARYRYGRPRSDVVSSVAG
jgi:membrane protease YdiL (CAAX protease family)